MAYTPELSLKGSATLRRLAWFKKKPMTKTLEEMVEVVSMELNKIKPGAVCGSCRDDNWCPICIFKQQRSELKTVMKDR